MFGSTYLAGPGPGVLSERDNVYGTDSRMGSRLALSQYKVLIPIRLFTSIHAALLFNVSRHWKMATNCNFVIHTEWFLLKSIVNYGSGESVPGIVEFNGRNKGCWSCLASIDTCLSDAKLCGKWSERSYIYENHLKEIKKQNIGWLNGESWCEVSITNPCDFIVNVHNSIQRF